MKDLVRKEDIINTFLDRLLADFESIEVEINDQVGREVVSKSKETFVQEKKLERIFPKFKAKVAESSSNETIK